MLKFENVIVQNPTILDENLSLDSLVIPNGPFILEESEQPFFKILNGETSDCRSLNLSDEKGDVLSCNTSGALLLTKIRLARKLVLKIGYFLSSPAKASEIKSLQHKNLSIRQHCFKDNLFCPKIQSLFSAVMATRPDYILVISQSRTDPKLIDDLVQFSSQYNNVPIIFYKKPSRAINLKNDILFPYLGMFNQSLLILVFSLFTTFFLSLSTAFFLSDHFSNRAMLCLLISIGWELFCLVAYASANRFKRLVIQNKKMIIIWSLCQIVSLLISCLALYFFSNHYFLVSPTGFSLKCCIPSFLVVLGNLALFFIHGLSASKKAKV